MPAYCEKGRFVISVELSADFPDDYEGDDDGYAWLASWKASVRPRVVAAAIDALRSDPSYKAIPISRGKDPEDEVEVEVTFLPDGKGLTP